MVVLPNRWCSFATGLVEFSVADSQRREVRPRPVLQQGRRDLTARGLRYWRLRAEELGEFLHQFDHRHCDRRVPVVVAAVALDEVRVRDGAVSRPFPDYL